jgi:hypothetical protein
MRRQSGQGKIGCMLWILAFGICAMVAYKMVPIKIRSAELADFMVEQAKWGRRATPEALKKSIVDRARDLELPLDEDDVKVERVRERIRMEATYTVPVEFPGYTYMWTFHHYVDRPVFVI